MIDVKLTMASSADLDRGFAQLQLLAEEVTRKVDAGEPLTFGEAMSVMQCIGITRGVLSERASVLRKREESNG